MKPKSIGSSVCVLLCTLLLASCTVKNTTKNLVPGKELSRNSLGIREETGDVTIREINPYTVLLRKKVCRTEQFAVEYQALMETREEKLTLECSDAYFDYVCHNMTAWGIPFIFDTITGFYSFRERCQKISPVYLITTAETGEVIKDEISDSTTTICKNHPVAGVTVTAKIKGEVLKITTSAKGIASLPKQKLAEIRESGNTYTIYFQYDNAELTTNFAPKKGEYDITDDASPPADDSDEGVRPLLRPIRENNETIEPRPAAPGQESISSPAVNPIEKSAAEKSSSGSASEKTVPLPPLLTSSGKESGKDTAAVGPAPLPSGVSPNLSGNTLIVRFDLNKAVVKPEFQPVLQKVADELKRHPSFRASIEGHTDNSGRSDTNQRLSKKRAINVKEMLVRRYGIKAERVETKWHGETRPVAENDSAEGRASNRRSEILIITLTD